MKEENENEMRREKAYGLLIMHFQKEYLIRRAKFLYTCYFP